MNNTTSPRTPSQIADSINSIVDNMDKEYPYKSGVRQGLITTICIALENKSMNNKSISREDLILILERAEDSAKFCR